MWNEISTEGGCTSADACRSRLVSPLPLHQTTKTFVGEADIRTRIEYTVDNKQHCSGPIAATHAWNLADADTNGRLSATEIPVFLFEMGIVPPNQCLSPTGQVVSTVTAVRCIFTVRAALYLQRR
jgi:hypothetical protein